MIGEITGEISEVPPNMGKIKRKSRIVPYLVRNKSTCLASLVGRIPINIFPPSRGWMGIRLKIARITLN